MNNKYAVCFSLYDNYKISEDSLYYYKGIIHCLGFNDRNFDIYIDTTEYCKNILLKICEQEKYSLDNVYFNIHEPRPIHGGMILRLNTFFKIRNKYDIICIRDSDLEMGQNVFYEIENVPHYSIYAPQQKCNNNLIFNWGRYQFFPGGNIYFKPKNFKTDLYKLEDIVTNICNFKNYKIRYEFDEYLYTNLFVYESYTNNTIYYANFDSNPNTNYLDCNIHLYKDIKYYWLINDIRQSQYFKDNTYILDNKYRKFDGCRPTSQNPQLDNKLSLLENTRTKHLMYTISRYILGYIDTINYKKYDFDYE